MTVPDWYALVILGLGVFRICRLVGWDDITAPLRPKLVGLSDEEHSQWTYVMNALVKVDADPWSYYSYTAEIEAFIDDVHAGLGLPLDQQVVLPPIVQRRLDKRHLAGPNDSPLVPFSKVEWYASKLIRCPWCLGFWLSALAWIAYETSPRGTLIVLSLFAVSALPGLIAKNLDA